MGRMIYLDPRFLRTIPDRIALDRVIGIGNVWTPEVVAYDPALTKVCPMCGNKVPRHACATCSAAYFDKTQHPNRGPAVSEDTRPRLAGGIGRKRRQCT